MIHSLDEIAQLDLYGTFLSVPRRGSQLNYAPRSSRRSVSLRLSRAADRDTSSPRQSLN